MARIEGMKAIADRVEQISGFSFSRAAASKAALRGELVVRRWRRRVWADESDVIDFATRAKP